MANPSTVNPTASGKEVLRRTYVDGAVEAGSIILTAPADHICTIISIVIFERENASDAMFKLYILPDGGAGVYLAINQPVSGFGTFTWNDKFVMTGGDVLKIDTVSAAVASTFDVWCSYIDADFS
jgi:hypothetical protein